MQGSQSPKVPKRETPDTSSSIPQTFLEGKYVFTVEGGRECPCHDLMDGKKFCLPSFLPICL